MIGLKHIAKIREYCDYVERHLKNIETAWKTMQEACKTERFICDDFFYWNINKMVREHDLSKFSPEEFIQYQQRFYPLAERSKEVNDRFAEAWKHHEDHNLHHWQSWTKLNCKNPYKEEMHCACMVIDWMAMGLEFGDTAESYYEKHKEKIALPEWAVSFIREIFTHLREHEASLV